MRIENKHHMLFGRKEWTKESQTHMEARRNPAFMLHLNKGWHGVLHQTIERVPLPEQQVAYDLMGIGEDASVWNDGQRIDVMLDTMAGYITMNHRNTAPQRRQMATIMGSFAAQKGIYDLAQSTRPML